MKKNLNVRKLLLKKKTVSVLKSQEMAAVKGGAVNTLSGITNPRSDSFIQCGSCFGACATNTTIAQQEAY